MLNFFLPEPGFWRKFVGLAVPITLQTLLFSANSMVDVFMVGQLNEHSVAALAICTTIIMVMYSLLSGMTTGINILAAQYFGAKDISGVKRIMMQGFLWATIIAIPFFLLFFFIPEPLMLLAIGDEKTAFLASQYMRVIAIGLLFLGLFTGLQAVFSVIGKPVIAFWFTFIAVPINMALNYVLIFGHFGLEPMGLEGAAIATLIAWFVETIGLMLFLMLRMKNYWPTLVDVKSSMTKAGHIKYLALCIPVTINGFMWAFGILIYDMIYGHMSVNDLAVMGLMVPIINFCFSAFWGVSNACSVMVGHLLGAKQFDMAWHQGKLLVLTGVLLAWFMIVILWFSQSYVLSLFPELPDAVINLAKTVLPIVLLTVWFRAFNVIVILGVLRSGGDNKFILYMDLACQWLLGIPLTFCAALVWQYSLPIVFLCAMSEEAIKMIICSARMWQRKWMRHLVPDAQAA